MYQLVLENNHEITKRLNLKDLYAILLVNKKLSTCVNEPNFWRLKLEYDYDISEKKPNQTWLERYNLTRSMGYICIPHLPDNPPLPFDTGKIVDICLDDTFICPTRLLNIRAINAMLVRPALYYLTDELEFYISGKRTYEDDDICENKLIDDNVTYITSSLILILYIKYDDLYVYTSKHEKLRLTYTENVVQVSTVYDNISYVTKDGLCYKIDEYDETNDYNEHKYVKSNIAKVIISLDGLLLLTKDNIFEMVGNFDSNIDLPKSKIIDLFGFIMFLTSDHKIVSFEHISESDGDSEETIQFTPCSNFDNISDIIGAAEGLYGKFCLTKTGEVYYSDCDTNSKFVIKAINIFESPEAIVLIL